ncbi:hypothetical protein NX059_011879 [Plenodomus lindquistii]|nr:hypothetical protein NX059_011879 [Plenodomus lindquistii]
MTSWAFTLREPYEILTTLAAALIVVYLALGFRVWIPLVDILLITPPKPLLISNRRNLTNTKHKLGLFASSQGDDPAAQLRHGPLDPDAFWTAWARLESIKRLIFCFTWLDMAYARLLDTKAVIDIDKIELHLPCDDGLFDGPKTAASFLHAIEHGAQLTMPRMNFRNFQATSVSKLNDISAQILLRALYLKVSAARTRLLDQDVKVDELELASPVEKLVRDSDAKEIIADLISLPTTHDSVLHGRNRMNALGWNYLCLLLTADIDLLEISSGRDGLEAASAALVRVSRWSQTTSARRAVLHAAQVFDILDTCRIRESHLTRPDLVLFLSALVISQYVLVSSNKDGPVDAPTFELLQDIDWTIVGDEGLGSATGSVFPTMVSNNEQALSTSSAAKCFLQNGGPISFAGEAQKFGAIAARKMARKFVHLMDGFGKWNGFSYSQLLKAMCGFNNELD